MEKVGMVEEEEGVEGAREGAVVERRRVRGAR